MRTSRLHRPGVPRDGAHASRVLVTGGSDGGYMTLAMSTNHAERIAVPSTWWASPISSRS